MNYSKFFFNLVDKRFLFRFPSKGGRNFLGRVCVFHRGGGKLHNYSHLDFFKRINSFGYIIKIFKNNKRTALMALIIYFNGLISQSILTGGLRVGSLIFSGDALSSREGQTKFGLGYNLPLHLLPMFSLISNLELTPYKGCRYVRAAGTNAVCISQTLSHCLLKLRSGWQVWIHNKSLAALGSCSNAAHLYDRMNKAGYKRNMGFRPVVRGVVKNPCDHPHGGGEGKGSPPAAQRSPWGKLTKGTPTKNTMRDRLLRRKFKNIN
jgi:large subunit ribosomal protein L2